MEKRLPCSGIGGQAVLEGIMMRKDKEFAVAIRKPKSKGIDLRVAKHEDITDRKKFLNIPFVRGIFKLIDSMVLGVRLITFSSQFLEDEELEPSKFENWLNKKFGEKAEKVIVGFSVFLSIVIAIALFFVLPLFVADIMEKYVPFITKAHVPIIEGVLKVLIFILYLVLTALLKDIRRTYMYHGAEHKCINCIETGHELNVENVAKSSRFHRRCGTSFIFLVILISIIIFLLIRPENIWLRYGIRILVIPVIAGISYEIIRLAGKSNSLFVRIISAPGMWMQRITTKEPTDDMIEVAITAVEAIFDWREYLKENGIEVKPKVERKAPEEYVKPKQNHPLPDRDVSQTGSGFNWKY